MRNSDSLFTDIYQTYYKTVYYQAYHIIKCPFLAEDITQESFLKAYKKMDTLQDQVKIGAWLACIAKRTAIDFLRKQGRSAQLMSEDSACLIPDMHDPIEMIAVKEDVEQRISGLSENQRQILLLKVNKGLKEKEIAEVLSIKHNTIKTHLHRARKQLKDLVEQGETA